MEAYRGGSSARAADRPRRDAARALFAAMARDADVFRGGLEIIGAASRSPQEVLARPGMAERVLALARRRAAALRHATRCLRLVA